MPGWGLGFIFKSFLDFLLPRYCFACGQVLTLQEILFCQSCGSSLPRLGPSCGRCAKPLATDGLCGECLAGRPFDRVISPFLYQGPVAQAIKELKYAGHLWLAKDLATLWRRECALPKVDLVVPVPLHVKRLFKRGFNQSLLLARFMKKGPVAKDLLLRHRETRPQVELPPKERKRNVKGAFRVRDPQKVFDQKILLVDDVMTTGVTIEECARVLKEAGAKEILVAVMARAG